MNFAIVDCSFSGASSWMRVLPSPTASMASRTPCSSLTSSCTLTHAEGVAVERDRVVEVGHGDADVVDLGEQAGHGGSCWSRGISGSWRSGPARSGRGCGRNRGARRRRWLSMLFGPVVSVNRTASGGAAASIAVSSCPPMPVALAVGDDARAGRCTRRRRHRAAHGADDPVPVDGDEHGLGGDVVEDVGQRLGQRRHEERCRAAGPPAPTPRAAASAPHRRRPDVAGRMAGIGTSWQPQPLTSHRCTVFRALVHTLDTNAAGYSGMSDRSAPCIAGTGGRTCTGRYSIGGSQYGWIGHRQRRAHADGPAARLAEGLQRCRPRRRRDQGRARALRVSHPTRSST